MKTAWWLLKTTAKNFLADDVIPMGASLAYYSLISLGPLLVLALTVFSKAVGRGPAEDWILEQVMLLAGERAMNIAQVVLDEASRPDLGSLGALLTLGLLLFGATAVFNNLQGALNRIWGVKPGTHMLRNILRTRMAAFFMVVALGVLMLVSVVVSTALSWVGPLLEPVQTVLPFIHLAELITTVLLLWLFVAATFQILPDVNISLRDVWMGSLATAVLLYLGKFGVSALLARSARASMYGAAGSLFLLLMWVYLSAQVFFLGAEFTQAWARLRGREIEPESYAYRATTVPVSEVKDADSEER
jgi:membrane protein